MLRKSGYKLAGILLMVVWLGGCLLAVGAALGIGAYQWAEGTMTKDYPRPMQDTYQACVAACQTLQLTIEKENYTPTDSSILAAMQNGTKVNINLTARPNDITSVAVRFGFMGNKDQSAYFHRTVMRNLGIE